jgi:hypothetical protein
VERDHGPPTGCAASFHTTRSGVVMRGAQSQAWFGGMLCEKVGPNVSDQAETDEKIHARCEALIALEGRSDP